MMTKFIRASAIACALAATPAAAADFSFVGTLGAPSDVLFFNFTVAADSQVTLRSYSYAGGVNAAGTVIARGGFDPILSLYDVATGNRVGQNDDGGCADVPADAVTGECFDTFFQSLLGPGDYRVAVTVYPNFAPDTLGGTFPGANTFVDVTGDQRNGSFAFDVLNVDTATGPGGVPEPATWALMILGFGAVGGAMRRRTKLSVRYAI